METCPPVPASFSSPTSSAILKKRIIAWSLDTDLPASVHVRIGGKTFDLHEVPLVSKSGYFRRALLDSSDVELSDTFPGGTEAFEMAALCCYGSPPPFGPSNVAAFRCAAHVLDMAVDFCERSDLYLNQVVLQSWGDTLIVLRKCQALLPWAEELLIVSRCVESLAFMACMEILDPEQTVKEMACQDLWVRDLVALPFVFFQRIIASLRSQGVKEKYVSPIIVFYANKWVISKETNEFGEDTDDGDDRVSEILEGILQMLPVGEKASRVIPAAFYFSLLSRSMTLSLSNESRLRLHDQVACRLHLARIDDFLLPGISSYSITSTPEFQAMERIVSTNISSNRSNGNGNGIGIGIGTPPGANSTVAELWDRYLSRIATDPNLRPGRFMELIEIVPMDDRETHDHLYRALSTFLVEHPHLKSHQKASLCGYLNCQKLSREKCIEAVQNELMPLRFIVQALFVQQLHTHRAFEECSGSFRCQIPRSQNLGGSPLIKQMGEGREVAIGEEVQRPELAISSYESASFRLEALEQELVSLKQSLQCPNVPEEPDHANPKLKGDAAINKNNALGLVGSCVGSISWATRGKCASRLLKALRRMSLLRKGKKKKAASAFATSKPLQDC